MSSQPNEARTGKLPCVDLTVDGELTVSAVQTFRALWDALGAEEAPTLTGLLASSPRAACYLDRPAPPEHPLKDGQLSPRAQRLHRLAPGPVADAATAAGCPTITWRIWSDEHRASYTDDQRTIEVIRVKEPWRYTCIDPAGRTEREVITGGRVDAGDYLVASVGVSALCVRKVGKVDRAPATGDLTALPDFGADRINAVCGKCRMSWFALDGASYFHPTTDGALPWQSGDVGEYGLVTNTVACPIEKCPGRISFRTGTDPQRY